MIGTTHGPPWTLHGGLWRLPNRRGREGTMPRKSTPATGMRDAFRYSPGDGHTYTWDGTSEHAAVYRHSRQGSRLDLVPTTDRVPMVGVARTATAFMAAVDGWHLVGTDWRRPGQRVPVDEPS